MAAMLAGLVLPGATTRARAADQGFAGPGDRLERLERRINELAERQEQMIRRLEAAAVRENARPMPQQRENQALRRRDVPPEPPGMAPMMRPENNRRPLAQAGLPVPEAKRVHKTVADLLGLLVIIGILCNILLAVWIFTDIRKRGEGSGLFVALALVAGIPTAIIYALVRIGDRRDTAKESKA
jgi:hypothetical protein